MTRSAVDAEPARDGRESDATPVEEETLGEGNTVRPLPTELRGRVDRDVDAVRGVLSALGADRIPDEPEGRGATEKRNAPALGRDRLVPRARDAVPERDRVPDRDRLPDREATRLRDVDRPEDRAFEGRDDRADLCEARAEPVRLLRRDVPRDADRPAARPREREVLRLTPERRLVARLERERLDARERDARAPLERDPRETPREAARDFWANADSFPAVQTAAANNRLRLSLVTGLAHISVLPCGRRFSFRGKHNRPPWIISTC